jgi:hypothetical protein
MSPRKHPSEGTQNGTLTPAIGRTAAAHGAHTLDETAHDGEEQIQTQDPPNHPPHHVASSLSGGSTTNEYGPDRNALSVSRLAAIQLANLGPAAPVSVEHGAAPSGHFPTPRLGVLPGSHRLTWDNPEIVNRRVLSTRKPRECRPVGHAACEAVHCSARSRQISAAALTKGRRATEGLRSGCQEIPSRRGGGSGRMGMTATFGSFSSTVSSGSTA